MDSKETFECYVGYATLIPDGYPKLQVGPYADAGAVGSLAARAAIQQVYARAVPLKDRSAPFRGRTSSRSARNTG